MVRSAPASSSPSLLVHRLLKDDDSTDSTDSTNHSSSPVGVAAAAAATSSWSDKSWNRERDPAGFSTHRGTSGKALRLIDSTLVLGAGSERAVVVGFGEKIGDKIPGYRYSTTFLSTLRQNLALASSLLPPDSAPSTPFMATSPPAALEKPSTTTTTPPPDLPPLTFALSTDSGDAIESLRLIADSIAQQRQVASSLIIRHPLTLSVVAAAFALVAQCAPHARPADLPLIFTTCAGVAMAALVAVRMLVGGYLRVAEEMGWSWLEVPGRDELVVARWGDRVIGVAVVRMEGRRKGGRGGRGVLRAWTVGIRWRAKGVGRGLLEEVVRVVVAERGAEVGWAKDHANSVRVIPKVFHRGFEKREERARALLEEIVKEQGGRRRSR